MDVRAGSPGPAERQSVGHRDAHPGAESSKLGTLLNASANGHATEDDGSLQYARLPVNSNAPAERPAQSASLSGGKPPAIDSERVEEDAGSAGWQLRSDIDAEPAARDSPLEGRVGEGESADHDHATLDRALDGSRELGSLSPKGDASEAGPSDRQGGEDGVGVAVGRRTTSTRPKDWAGSVMWAKLAKYPWWPAQVLDEADPWIPNDSEMPRRGAIPVRFFGTYDFAWIESQRALCSYDQNFEEHSTKIKQKAFTDALAEASHFQKTQELPNGFNEDMDPSPQKAPKKGKGSGGKGKGKKSDAAGGAGGKGSKRAAEDGTSHRRSVRERQDSIMQTLALVPPPDSPYSHSINLDGVRRLMALQEAGRYPPPAPVPQPTQQQTFAGQATFPPAFSAAQFAAPVLPTAAQQAQLQQLQQQLQAASQGRPTWPLHFQGLGSQVPLSFFQAQGGVQGALLAAASQGQFQPKQF